VLSLLVATVVAQTANPYLVSARALVRELKFAEAIAQLEVARQVPDLDRAQRIETLELLAKCHVAEGNREPAEAAFTALLSLAPEHELDRATSPKIVELFDTVKRRLFPDERVSLVEETAPPGRVRARVVDPFHRAARVELRVKTDGSQWRTERLELRDGAIDFSEPTSEAGPISWYVRVMGPNDAAVASLGSEESPRVRLRSVEVGFAAPTRQPPRPRLIAGIVTGIAALAMLAGATALQVNAQALDAASRDRSRPPGDWADTARATHARAVEQARWSFVLYVVGGMAAGVAVVLVAW
jgi:hypothetical protein